jgi:fused signal recognition particle receptor
VLLGRKLDEELIQEIERRLLQADVGVQATTKLIESIRGIIEPASSRKVRMFLIISSVSSRPCGRPPTANCKFAPAGVKPTVILMTGVNGAGKTTSIAKLCHTLRSEGRTVLLGACDTFRAGAVRQLEIWAERLGVEVVKGQQGGDPAAVAFDACAAAKARGVDVLILDTAGRLQTQDPLMRQLTKIRSVDRQADRGRAARDAAGARCDGGAERIAPGPGVRQGAGVTGIFLTKLDGTAKGGIVVAIARRRLFP